MGREEKMRIERLCIYGALILWLVSGCRDVVSEVLIAEELDATWNKPCQVFLYYQKIGTMNSPVYYYGDRQFWGTIQEWEIMFDDGDIEREKRFIIQRKGNCD